MAQLITTEIKIPNGNQMILGNQHYRIQKQVGNGSFGSIYLLTNTRTGQLIFCPSPRLCQDSRSLGLSKIMELALKMEIAAECDMLKHEYEIMKMMKGTRGIPNVRWYGSWEQYNCLLMDFLGPSLEDLFKFCSDKFSLKTVLMLAGQIINVLESFHKINYVHGDLKPSNFLIGHKGPTKNVVYLIDFGLSKKYIRGTNNAHIIYREDRPLIGTARYVSLNGHLGIEQSRRDDLESLGYVLIQFLNGKLPWQNLRVHSSKKDAKMREIKMSISLERLTKDCPVQFHTYMKYVRGLKFTEAPDYEYIRRLFDDLLQTMIKSDAELVFDWTLKTNREEIPH